MSRIFLTLLLGIIALSGGLGATVWYFANSTEGAGTEPPSSNSDLVPMPEDRRSKIEDPPTKFHLPPGIQISFANVTRSAGIDFVHFDGRTDMEYIMDQTGSGLAWLDYDQDGLMDLFFVQGYTFAPPYPVSKPACKMFKNLGGGRFKDVTAELGLGPVGPGQGVAAGDIDNDGYPDLFLTCYGKPNVLYHNVSDGQGGRKFVDITASAGLADHPDWHTRPNFSTSAAFLDYNNDGLLDLFVCSYVHIDMAHYPPCFGANGRRGPCPPSRFEGTHCLLYRNNGNGTFTDVSTEAGIDKAIGKALGVVALDLDDDGLIDIFVANDTVPNFLFHNLGHGRFESIGPMGGCAVNLAGTPQAYMGVDADDLNSDGRPDLYVTAFARETDTFFRNEGHCQFLDITSSTGLGPPSWSGLAFGTCFLDVDLDGSLDIAVSNGHVSRNVDAEGDPANTFRQRAQLYLNNGHGHFDEISRLAGPYFQERHVGRGLAYADYDNDGHMDLAFNNSGEPAVLLHNESKTPYHWLRLELRGTRSNRDAVGACVTVQAGGRKLVRHRKGGGSYLSAHDPRLLIGLGSLTKADRVEIRWPSGSRQVVGPLEADRGYRITEGAAKIELRP
jgi:enediyne biosynthesis protein E4